ncbi:glycosyltransferase [Salinivibrio kushneri]|uniref:glycosyltransferase n=1 Tax=Salinivibrio kushneri TaxID=1908198 RepID=UPI0022B4E22C|nr:glycosyltransferase [Salinivibrio kushneri]WBA10877.1 glycosyltransferase [Salinivibrio kushneri]
MKIDYITMQFPVPSETFASLDVEALREQGVKVSVRCMRFKHPLFSEMMKDRKHQGLEVSHFSLSRLFFSILFVIRHPVIAASLFSWVTLNCIKSPKHFIKSVVLLPSAISIFNNINKDRPDVVHLFWGHYPAMVGYLVKRFIPNIVVSQFLGAHDLVTNYPCSISLAKEVDKLFTHSHSNLATLSKAGVDTKGIEVVFRGTKLINVENVNRKDMCDDNHPVFLTASRLIEEKGVDDVLRVYEKVAALYPKSKLIIAGDGPYRDKLEKLISEIGCEGSVDFIGHVSQPELIKEMAKANFFLLMSRYPSERLPNVVKEAMYQQCVVITTETHGIRELIEHEVEGFIVKKNDIDEAYKLISQCIDSPQRYVSTTTAAKKKIEENFNVNKTMARYIDVWFECLNK